MYQTGFDHEGGSIMYVCVCVCVCVCILQKE